MFHQLHSEFFKDVLIYNDLIANKLVKLGAIFGGISGSRKMTGNLTVCAQYLCVAVAERVF